MEAERSTRAGIEIVVTAARGVAVRAPLVKRITTVGSAADADLRVAALPPHWATIHGVGGAVDVHVLASGERATIVVGGSSVLDGISIAVSRVGEALALDQLADRLAGVDGADEALATILDGVIGAAGADLGAVILAEPTSVPMAVQSGLPAAGRGGFTVALARDAGGRPLADAAELLSDTIVGDVLGSGEGVIVGDVAGTRYGQVRSVVLLGLSSVVCLPLRLGGKTLGAIFVGARGRPLVVADRVHADLKVVAALALPFLAQARRGRTDAAPATDAIVGEAPVIEEVRRLVRRVGASDLGVLISGPSGAGKEVVARALHAMSPRAARPLVAINCAAVAPTLLDSELFGYRKGAFTGAVTDRPGLIEAAQGGAVFLDEIGDMPLPMQAALLRVLEQREVRRLGDTEPRPVDFRLITATHRDLAAEVAAGRFREDLLFRIQEVKIAVPPLAARGDDVLLLGRVFLRQIEAQLGLVPHELGADAIAALRAHPWPGNVRELKGAMRRAAILADGATITAADLQLPGAPAAKVATGSGDLGDTSRRLEDARDEFVRRYVQAALDRNGGNREAAARELGIGVRTLYRYIGE